MTNPDSIRPINWTRVGAALAFVAVALGAFGAHGLESMATSEQLEWWETGVRYQLIHAVGLLILGLSVVQQPASGARAKRVGSLFVLGVILFSGSLYALALGAPRWFGAVAPLGGVAYLAGWALWAWSGSAQDAGNAGRASDSQ